jgi:hypothetical protein
VRSNNGNAGVSIIPIVGASIQMCNGEGEWIVC